MILAHDQATTTGWAVGEPGGRPSWGSLRFDGDRPGIVYANFRSWLVRVMTAERPDVVIFEKPYIPMPRKPRFAAAGTGDFWAGAQPAGGIVMNALTLRRLLYMAGCIDEVCEQMGVRDCREVSPSEISKFLLGRTPKRAEKKAATIAMVRAYGFDVQDDNAADAVAMWLMTEARFHPRLASQRGSGPLFLKPAPAKGGSDARTLPNGRRPSGL